MVNSVYKVGDRMVNRRDKQVYVITEIICKTNHKGRWNLYTFKNDKYGTYCLRVRDIKRKFIMSKAAHILYTTNV